MLPDTTNITDLSNDWEKATLLAYKEAHRPDGTLYGILSFSTDSGIYAKAFLGYSKMELWKVKSFKRAIGMGDKEVDITPYLGKQIYVKLRYVERDGKDYFNVVGFKSLSASNKDKDEANDLPF